MKSKYIVNPEVQAVVAHVYGSRLHGSLGRKVFTLATTFEKALSDFQKVKSELQQTYALKDDEGNIVSREGHVVIPAEKLQEFNERYSDLLETDYPVKRLEIEDIEDVPSISAKEIKVLVDSGLVKN